MRSHRRFSAEKEKGQSQNQKKTLIASCGIAIATCLMSMPSFALPDGFVYLQKIDSTIQRDIRYAGKHNFIGRAIHGYDKPQCILTRDAALALSKIQKELQQSSLSLKVYDCYRPEEAVKDFLTWSKLPKQQEMKAEFYPDTNKDELFKLGYIAAHSSHSRGSTVDITIVPLPYLAQPNYRPGEKLVSCKAPYLQRYRDNTIDMGTGYDCIDPKANVNNPDIGIVAKQNRALLRELMIKYGFVPYEAEWWHFTLKNEPYPEKTFNFSVK